MKIDFAKNMVSFIFENNYGKKRNISANLTNYVQKYKRYYVSAALNHKNDSITIIPTTYA